MSEKALNLICMFVFLHFPLLRLPLSLPVLHLSFSPHLYLLLPFYFAPFSERMKLPFMTDQCEQMLKICNEFVRLQVSYEEYLCMKVLLLLSTGK